MDKESDIAGSILDLCLIIFLIAAALFGGLAIGMDMKRQTYTTLAIENNCAQYNSQSGKFEWRVG